MCRAFIRESPLREHRRRLARELELAQRRCKHLGYGVFHLLAASHLKMAHCITRRKGKRKRIKRAQVAKILEYSRPRSFENRDNQELRKWVTWERDRRIAASHRMQADLVERYRLRSDVFGQAEQCRLRVFPP